MPRRLHVLFVLKSLKQLSYFDASLDLLVERGHVVRLLLEKRIGSPAEEAWLEGMLTRPGFTCDLRDDLRRDPWRETRFRLTAALGYVWFQGAAFAGMPLYTRRALDRSPPRLVRRLARLPLVRTHVGLRCLYAFLAAMERALPIPTRVNDYLADVSPDVVVLGDFKRRRSLHSAFVRAAMKQGVPVGTLVASWDNLSAEPRMTAIPHRLVVWNETQVREAVELHRVPADRIVVTGAAKFDHWFGWSARPREEFLARVGLDPAKPMVLWTGGALRPWEPSETEVVERWLAALRSADDRHLRDVGVLMRPHPLRLDEWLDADFSTYGRAVVWPRDVSMPIDPEQQADYHDSVFHSRAVVGINTSAMIEAAIVDRLVLSWLEPTHHDSQEGSLHFAYLFGGVRIARTLEQHLADLQAVLEGRDLGGAEATRRFVADFVRPRGLDHPAAPFVVDAIEQLAELDVERSRDPLWVNAVRPLMARSA